MNTSSDINNFKSKLYTTTSGDFSIINAESTGKINIREHETPYLFLTNYYNSGNYYLNKQHIEVSENSFYFLNQGDKLEINFKNNLHRKTVILQLCDVFMQNVYTSLSKNDKDLLDLPIHDEKNCINIPNVPFSLNKNIRSSLNNILSLLNTSPDLYLEKIYNLLKETAKSHKCTTLRLIRINAVKKSTREEVYRRCYTAMEYINEHFSNLITLDELCSIATMNKFHFIDRFEEVYKITPYQYIKQLKLNKAHLLLKTQRYTIMQVCFEVGFESPSTFSYNFRKAYGYPPSKLLNSKNPNFE